MPTVSVRLSEKEKKELLRSGKSLSGSIRAGINLYIKNEKKRKILRELENLQRSNPIATTAENADDSRRQHFIVERLIKRKVIFEENQDILTLDFAVYEVANSIWKHEFLLKELKTAVLTWRNS